MSTAAQQITATFTQARTTPGTVVYKEEATSGAEVIGSVYVKKAAAKELGDPKKIVVTINPAI